MFQRQSSSGVQIEKKPTGSRKFSWKTVAWLSALPSLFAFVVSVFVHAGAIGAMMALGYPANLDEPEPVAVNVELVSDTATQDSSPEKEQKVEALPVAAEAATSDSIDVAEPVEAEDTVALAATEDLPAAVPVPIMRPKQQQRKKANQALEKSPLAKTKGKAIDQNFDIGQNEELVQINTSASANALEARRGETRTSNAEQRWLAQLSAHLERRKRYPAQAQSRRQEGVVRVSFIVAPDGTVMAAELVTSSGVAALDEEVLDLLRRASPVPKPPPDANPVITVPVDFSIKR